MSAGDLHAWKSSAVIGAVKKLGSGPSPSGRGRRDSLIEAGAPGEGRAKREPARSASAIARSLKQQGEASREVYSNLVTLTLSKGFALAGSRFAPSPRGRG